MKNHEICKYVNSKDIRKHLIDIGYIFSTAEAAWLVNQCHGITLQEKIKAWEDIISTMPDQSINSFHFDKPYESIHNVIKDYISMKKKTLEMFLEESPKSFYQHMIQYEKCKDSFDDSMPCSSYDKCCRQLLSDLKNSEGDDFEYACIRRSEIDSFYDIKAYYNHNAEITDVRIPPDYGVFDWEITDFFDCLQIRFIDR